MPDKKGDEIMKVAVSSSGKDLNSQLDPRFGRCAYFLVVHPDDMSFEVFDNGSSVLGGGAGIQSAQFLASKGVDAVITGNCGPNAVQTLSAAGVELFAGQTGTVKEVVEKFKKGQLRPTSEATVDSHFGMPPGAGSGSGGGMGGSGGMRQGTGGGGGMRQGTGSGGGMRQGTGSGGGMRQGTGSGGGRRQGKGSGGGMRQGMGGGGMRQGMGGGRGRGRGMGAGSVVSGRRRPMQKGSGSVSNDSELESLKKKADDINNQLESIINRLNDLQTSD
jgi:predicted Fe-Mo cluster-binding NifX family protein